MKLFGSLSELVQVKWRKNGKEITSRPNQATTYTADKDIQLPPGDTNHVLLSETATQTVSGKSIDADTNTITNIENADIKAGAAVDAAKIANGSVSSTEFQYLDGVTSAIQAQFTGKEPAFSVLPISKGGTNSGTALNNNRVIASIAGAIAEASAITAARALISDVNGIPTHSVVTATELAFISGVTSAIQTQFSGKQNNIITTQGDLIVGNASNVADRLPIGTSGLYLKSNGTTASWQAGATSNESLSTKTDTSYTILDNDSFTTILMNITSATGRTLTLPSPSNNTNRAIRIKRIGTGTGLVTIARNGSESIDGVAANYTLPVSLDWVQLQSDGTNWYILDKGYTASIDVSGITFTGAGTTSAATIKGHRRGNMLYVQGTATQGTCTATPFKINLPSGISLDYSQLSTTATQKVGELNNFTNSSAGTYSVNGQVANLFSDGSDTAAIYGGYTTISRAFNKHNATDFLENAGKMTFYFEIPVTGWND